VQTTLKTSVTFDGIGLHSASPVRLVVRPAVAGTGIVFVRTDVPQDEAALPALWDKVEVTPLNTRLRNDAGVTLSTIEHLMAAFAGCGVHNARVEVDGPEVPILDGSSAALKFCAT